jgi:hypothetical protein
MIRDGRDQRLKEGDQQAIATASGLITARQQQRAADQQFQQAAGLQDLRNAALAPDAPKAAGDAYFKAVAPDKYLQNQLDAPQREATLAETKARTDRYNAQAQRDARNIRGLTAGLQKEEDEDIQAFGSTKAINGSLDRINGQIADGSLQLGPWTNAVSSVQNAVGASDDVSSNFASFQATLEKLRNESLRLNKGTQTEGDAQRAWNELFTNIRDPKIVQQRIKEIASYNDAAASLNVAKINNRRKNQGLDELDVNELLRRNQQSQQPAQQQGQAQQGQQARPTDSPSTAQQPVYTISTDDQYARLPSGAQYIDPQGNHRSKP